MRREVTDEEWEENTISNPIFLSCGVRRSSFLSTQLSASYSCQVCIEPTTWFSPVVNYCGSQQYFCLYCRIMAIRYRTDKRVALIKVSPLLEWFMSSVGFPGPVVAGIAGRSLVSVSPGLKQRCEYCLWTNRGFPNLFNFINHLDCNAAANTGRSELQMCRAQRLLNSWGLGRLRRPGVTALAYGWCAMVIPYRQVSFFFWSPVD